MHTYDSYKDSGIDWLGKIPSHWEAIKIKNFFKTKSALFIDGDWIESKDIYGEDVYYFTTGNINELYFKDNERTYITEQTFNKLNCTAIAENDILVSRLNVPLGRCCLAPKFDKKSIVSVDVVIFRPDENYNRKYLVYIMNSPSYFQNTENIARGAIMKRISRTILGNIKLPIPPLHEQEAIACFLDEKCAKIDELVAIKEQQIDKLKELRQVKIHQAVTKGINPNVEMKDSGIDWIGEIPKHWEVKRLKSIATIVLGKMLCNEDKGNYEYKPYLKSKNIQWLNVNVDSVDYMWFSKAEQLQYKLMKGDLILSEGGEVGKVCIWNDELEECYIQNSVHKVTVDKLNNSKFYLYSFFTIGKLGIFESIVNKVSIGHLTREKLVNILVPVPPLPEQEAIVAYLEEATNKIDQAIAQREAQIEKLKAYKQSLINEVVTGKVKVC